MGWWLAKNPNSTFLAPRPRKSLSISAGPGTENPRVGGSIPSLTTKVKNPPLRGFFAFKVGANLSS